MGIPRKLSIALVNGAKPIPLRCLHHLALNYTLDIVLVNWIRYKVICCGNGPFSGLWSSLDMQFASSECHFVYNPTRFASVFLQFAINTDPNRLSCRKLTVFPRKIVSDRSFAQEIVSHLSNPIPRGLKPRAITGMDVRAKARTLQRKSEGCFERHG